MPAEPTMRASDADREQTVAVLTEHVGAGRLSLNEFDERASAAYAAQTLGELHGLLLDLPSAPGTSVDWRPAWSWAGVGAINLVIWTAISVSVGELLYFWPGWVIGPWGAVLLVRHLTGRQQASHRVVPDT